MAEKEDNNIIKIIIEYCPICTLPYEYCEYGPCYEQCLLNIQENKPELLNNNNNNNNILNNINKLNINENNNEENNENNENEEVLLIL